MTWKLGRAKVPCSSRSLLFYCPMSIHSFLGSQEDLVLQGVSEAGLGVGGHSRVRSAASYTTGVSFDAVVGLCRWQNSIIWRESLGL